MIAAVLEHGRQIENILVYNNPTVELLVMYNNLIHEIIAHSSYGFSHFQCSDN